MRVSRFRFQFRVKLHGDEEGMVRPFNNFRQMPIRRQAGDFHAGRLQLVTIGDIALLALTVALGYLGCPIHPASNRP